MNLRLKEPSVRFITVHVLGNKPTVAQLRQTETRIKSLGRAALEALALLLFGAMAYGITIAVFSL